MLRTVNLFMKLIEYYVISNINFSKYVFAGNSHKNGTSDNSINHLSLDTDEDMGQFK